MSRRAGEPINTYLHGKPKGIFGKHNYKKAEGGTGTAAEERAALRHYQEYFGVPSEG